MIWSLEMKLFTWLQFHSIVEIISVVTGYTCIYWLKILTVVYSQFRVLGPGILLKITNKRVKKFCIKQISGTMHPSIYIWYAYIEIEFNRSFITPDIVLFCFLFCFDSIIFSKNCWLIIKWFQWINMFKNSIMHIVYF